jgi:hypothetical protein
MIEFVPIKNWEEYLIYNDGRVYSIKSNIFIKITDNGNGYKKVSIWQNGINGQFYIHRLVAQHFIDNPDNKKYVDHIDRNKDNNHYTNIRWVTASENINNIAGESRYSVIRTSKWHNKELRYKVVELRLKGLKVSEVAKELNIPRQTVNSILKRLICLLK